MISSVLTDAEKKACTALTDAEKKVCIVLSYLFLDTQLSPEIISAMASNLKELNMPIPALEHILRYDVFPILYTNLMNIAGEWSCFDDEWLLNRVESGRMTNPVLKVLKAPLDFVAWYLLGRTGIIPVWNEIKEILQSKT
jgi:hypothetical protein